MAISSSPSATSSRSPPAMSRCRCSKARSPPSRSWKHAAACFQLREGGDRALLHRHRLIAGGDLELVAEGEDDIAILGHGALGGLADVEVGEVADLLFLDLHEGGIEISRNRRLAVLAQDD